MARGLDRRITVRVASEGGTNQFGEPTPSTTIDYDVWATRLDGTEGFAATEAGIRLDPTLNYRIRWRSDVAGTPAYNLTVIPDQGGAARQVEQVSEYTTRDGTARRRWLDLRLIAPVQPESLS